MKNSRRRAVGKDAVERSRTRGTETYLHGSLFKSPLSGAAAATPPNGKGKKPNYGLQRDYRVLAKEKKVSTILKDLELRSKLESIVQDQAKGKKPSNKAQSSPVDRRDDTYSKPHPHQLLAISGGRGIVIPINDLDMSTHSPAEAQLRGKLAAVHRLADMLGWCRITHSHITALAPGGDGNFFIKAHGLLYYEVTSSNLVCVNCRGEVVDEGSSGMGVSESGAWLHSVVHRTRSDVGCILHLQHTAVMAVSSLTSGLLPVSSHAISVGEAAYCEASWFGHDANEDELAVILGESKVVILRGCGMLALGINIEDAFRTAHALVKACEVQVAALSAGLSAAMTDIQAPWWDTNSGHGFAGEEVEFEALMRMLDRMGYQTGYKYHSAMDGLGNLSRRKQLKETKPTGDCRVDKNDTSGGTVHEDLQQQGVEIVRDTAQRVAKSTGEALERVTNVESKGLNLSDEVTATAQKVAKSTGEVLAKMTKQGGSQGLNSSDQVMATAKRVAQSTGEVLGRVMHKEGRPEQDMLDRVQETAQRVAKSTGDALERASQAMHPERTSMLQQAELAAERVASSTSHALQRLANGSKMAEEEERIHVRVGTRHVGTPRHGQAVMSNGEIFANMHDNYSGDLSSTSQSLRSLSSLDEATRGRAQREPTVRRLPLLPSTTKQADADEPKVSTPLYNGYKEHDPTASRHVNRVKKTRRSKRTPGSTSSSSEYSTTESVEVLPGYRSSLVAHRQSVIDDPDLYESALQRMTHTAELVAASTGQAVITLSSSLLS